MQFDDGGDGAIIINEDAVAGYIKGSIEACTKSAVKGAMDEATSQLDRHQDTVIRNAVKSLMSQCICGLDKYCTIFWTTAMKNGLI